MVDPATSALLDLLQAPCFVLRRDGTLLVANKAAREALRLRREALEGRRLQDLAADAAAATAFLGLCARSTSPAIGSVALVAGDGRALDFHAEGALYLPGRGEPLLFVQLTRRETALGQFHALNEQLVGLKNEVIRRQRAEAALAKKVGELADADKSKNRFIAVLSHELRNPLSPIRNATYLLRLARDGEAREAAISMIERHVAHLVRLLDDLLDVSRITSGKLRLRIQPVCLDEVVAHAKESVHAKISAASQTLDVQLPEPLWVQADVDRVRQIVANLLDNASKFSPRGGRIFVTGRHEDGGVALRVTDSGPGVASEIAHTLFGFFVQGNDQSARQNGGLGLGLALSKALAELQGGELTLGSEPDAPGACFCLRLPAASALAGADAGSRPAQPQASQHQS